MARIISWAMPGIVFTAAFSFAACTDADGIGTARFALNGCPTGSGGGSAASGEGSGESASSGSGIIGSPGQEPGGTITTGNEKGAFQNNTFDHFNDPGSDGQLDPFQVAQENALEGPPEVRTRLHSCDKIPYSALGTYLTSRGVDLTVTAAMGQLPTAGDLYNGGGNALGVAQFATMDAESYFLTTAGATKLFDIFVNSAPQIIANIGNPMLAPSCTLKGVNQPMFSATDGSCVYESVTCLIGRPATTNDLTLCNSILAQAAPGDMNDLMNKQYIAVGAMLSAANTCE